jgi:hypothetical protein
MLERRQHNGRPCLSLPWFSPINTRETRRGKKDKGRGIQEEKGQTEERREKGEKNKEEEKK